MVGRLSRFLLGRLGPFSGANLLLVSGRVKFLSENFCHFSPSRWRFFFLFFQVVQPLQFQKIEGFFPHHLKGAIVCDIFWGFAPPFVCDQKALDLNGFETSCFFLAQKVRIYFVFPSCDFDGFGWPQKSETHNFLNPLNGNNLLSPTSFGKTWGTLGTSPGEKKWPQEGKVSGPEVLESLFWIFQKQGRMVEPRKLRTSTGSTLLTSKEFRLSSEDPRIPGVSFEKHDTGPWFTWHPQKPMKPWPQS